MNLVLAYTVLSL